MTDILLDISYKGTNLGNLKLSTQQVIDLVVDRTPTITLLKCIQERLLTNASEGQDKPFHMRELKDFLCRIKDEK